jgi:hypothetical protein
MSSLVLLFQSCSHSCFWHKVSEVLMVFVLPVVVWLFELCSHLAVLTSAEHVCAAPALGTR